MHFLVERYWPGVRQDEAMAALRRVHEGCRQLAEGGVSIRWVGGVFVAADETLSSSFDGTSQAVRSVFEIAGEPFDRMMQICRLEPD